MKGRASGTGNRHEINYEHVVLVGMKRTRATCVCGNLNTPFRFTSQLAEEDGIDHMANIPKKGKPPKREETSEWAETEQI